MLSKSIFVFLVLLIAQSGGCLGERTLVLLGDSELESSHSVFLNDLSLSGLDLEVRAVTDKQLRLQSWGQWLYENVLILSARESDFGGAIDASYLIDFVDSGRNLFVATDETVPNQLRELAAELGADFLDKGCKLQDHVSHSVNHGPSGLLSQQLSAFPAIVGSAVSEPVLYAGTGLTTAPDTTLSMVPITAELTATASKGKASGTDIAFVVATQTRTNARFVATGSLDMFSNAFFNAEVTHSLSQAPSPTGNRALSRELAMWAFKLKSVVKLENFRHRRPGQPQPPPLNTYTVGDDITIEMDITERRGADWLPHKSDSVQAQFVMLDPHIRRALSHDGNGHYSLTVKAPDVYGVFKWVIDYKSPGYTFVHLQEVTPLRPLRHNEYPRFIVQAYPYYTSLLVLSAAFFVMIGAVMFHESSAAAGTKTK